VSLLSQAPYPPSDFIPDTRDVQAPYGNMCIYEFGLEENTGKMLLVHGISNPASHSPVLLLAPQTKAAE
jgi:hypothetical protein